MFNTKKISFALLMSVALSSALYSSTGTSLDNIVDTIHNDIGLGQNVSETRVVAGAEAAQTLNTILVEAIRETGVANLGDITLAGLKEVMAYIETNHYEEWMKAYGSESWATKGKRRNAKRYVVADSESGFHYVNNNGAESELLAVASNIYALFKESDKVRLSKAKKGGVKRKIQGEITKRRLKALNTLNTYLNSEDFIALKSIEADGENSPGNFTSNTDFYQTLELTDTGLDVVIDKIRTDLGLHRSITASMMNEGMDGANKLNHLLIEAIKATGAADNGKLIPGSLIDIDKYISTYRFDYMQKIHGCEKENTGWHAVVDTGSRATWTDGATVDTSKGDAFIDTRMDSIYHLGFGFRKSRVMNEAGTPLGNVHIKTLTQWMNETLNEEDMQKLHSGAAPVVNTYTGTNFDRLIQLMIEDKGTYITTSRQVLIDAVEAAYKMNMILIHSIKELDEDGDGFVSPRRLAPYIETVFGDEWKNLKSKVNPLLGKPRLAHTAMKGIKGRTSNLVGGIYTIGEGLSKNKRKLGNRNVRVSDVGVYMRRVLAEEELPETHYVYSKPRKIYNEVNVNYGSMFAQTQPISKEDVDQKITEYIDSIKPKESVVVQFVNGESMIVNP